jgi:hypothetical protein
MGVGVRQVGSARAAAVAAAVTALVLVAGALTWHPQAGSRHDPPARTRVVAPVSSVDRAPWPAPARHWPARRTCAQVPHHFAPVTITVSGVGGQRPVVRPAREADGVPGVPPLTTTGKTEFAWDRAQGIRPGDRAGNVLLNAHTWPDGSALGNHLLAALHRGGRIVVRGAGERLCYRVTERVEVPAARGMPRYYAKRGPPQLAIVVCSGRRLGPGVWTKRTIWFASPSV